MQSVSIIPHLDRWGHRPYLHSTPGQSQPGRIHVWRMCISEMVIGSIFKIPTVTPHIHTCPPAPGSASEGKSWSLKAWRNGIVFGPRHKWVGALPQAQWGGGGPGGRLKFYPDWAQGHRGGGGGGAQFGAAKPRGRPLPSHLRALTPPTHTLLSGSPVSATRT